MAAKTGVSSGGGSDALGGPAYKHH